MSLSLPTQSEPFAGKHAFVPAIVIVALVAAVWSLAALAPLGFSIAIVFLFAGPHNWLEARYMLQRMPARWGQLWRYFAIGIGGTVLLTSGLALISVASRMGSLDGSGFLTVLAFWNTLLIAWVVALATLRKGQNPKRDWPWLVPLGFLAISAAWIIPILCSLALVYLHPLLSLWFLDRELARTKSSWLGAYRFLLCCLPIAIAAMWLVLARTPNLPGDDALAAAIASHAGGGILHSVSTHLLVSTHAFLEMLHYGVWIVAIPSISLRRWPWEIDNVPLARRGVAWRRAVLGIVVVGAVVMVVLWGAFLADYAITRDIYFTVATLHVLAEVPFLLRLL